MNIIKVIPETLCKDSFIIRDRQIQDILGNIGLNETFCNFVDDSENVQSRDPILHQSSFLHLVTETVFDYPHNSFSEKTWKPIVNFRPFIIVGPPHSLRDLQALGFKTFSNWWDEGYDKIVDPLLRMKAIIDVLKKICGHTLEDLLRIYDDMESTLKFNYEHYYGSFIDDSLLKFHKKCQENLLPR